MSGEGVRYQATGFIPINDPPARRKILADTDTIVKGDVLHDDGNGLATNEVTAFDSALFLGVAAADCDNSGDEDLEVEYYPLDEATQYRVPVEADAEISQTAIGLNVDLEAVANLIDISDTVTTGLAFRIDAIDISALATAAKTFGYAIGHFARIIAETG